MPSRTPAPNRLPPGPLAVITPDGTEAITEKTVRHVALVTCGHATGLEDARRLLDELGIIGKPRPLPQEDGDRPDPYRAYHPRATASKARP